MPCVEARMARARLAEMYLEIKAGNANVSMMLWAVNMERYLNDWAPHIQRLDYENTLNFQVLERYYLENVAVGKFKAELDIARTKRIKGRAKHAFG